jgi:hypothetical protein
MWEEKGGADIAADYVLEALGSILGRARVFSLVHSVKTGSGPHPPSDHMGTRGSFPRSKAGKARISLHFTQCKGQERRNYASNPTTLTLPHNNLKDPQPATCFVLVSCLASPWRWRRLAFNGVHGATWRKTELCISAASTVSSRSVIAIFWIWI